MYRCYLTSGHKLLWCHSSKSAPFTNTNLIPCWGIPRINDRACICRKTTERVVFNLQLWPCHISAWALCIWVGLWRYNRFCYQQMEKPDYKTFTPPWPSHVFTHIVNFPWGTTDQNFINVYGKKDNILWLQFTIFPMTCHDISANNPLLFVGTVAWEQW